MKMHPNGKSGCISCTDDKKGHASNMFSWTYMDTTLRLELLAAQQGSTKTFP